MLPNNNLTAGILFVVIAGAAVMLIRWRRRKQREAQERNRAPQVIPKPRPPFGDNDE